MKKVTVIALVNSYVEIEMVHMFPGIIAINYDVLGNR